MKPRRGAARARAKTQLPPEVGVWEPWEPEPYRPEPSTASGSRAQTPPPQPPPRCFGRDAEPKPSATVAAEVLQRRHATEVEALQNELAAEVGRRRREHFDWRRRLHQLESSQARTAEQVDQLAQQVVEEQQEIQKAEEQGRLQWRQVEGMLRQEINDLRASAVAGAGGNSPLEARLRSFQDEVDSLRGVEDARCRQPQLRGNERPREPPKPAGQAAAALGPLPLEARLDRLQEEVDILCATEQWRLLQEGSRLKEQRWSDEQEALQRQQVEGRLHQEVAELRVQVVEAAAGRAPLEAQQWRLQEELAALRDSEQRRQAQRGDELEAARLSERQARAASDREIGELLNEVGKQQAVQRRAEATAREAFEARLEAMSRAYAAELGAARASWGWRCAEEAREARRGVEVAVRLRSELQQQDDALASLWDLRSHLHGQEAKVQELRGGLCQRGQELVELQDQLLQAERRRQRACEECKALAASEGAALQNVELRAEEATSRASACSAASQEAAGRAEARLLKAEQLALQHEGCLAAQLGMLEARTQALNAEATRAAQDLAGSTLEAAEARRQLDGVLQQHADSLREAEEGILCARSERDVEAGELWRAKELCIVQSQALQAHDAVEASQAERLACTEGQEQQLWAEATALRAELADTERRHGDHLQAERRDAEKHEESLLWRVHQLEEAERNSDSVLQDRLSKDKEIIGDLRSYAENLLGQLGGSLQLVDHVCRMCRDELGGLPPPLREEVLAASALQEVNCEAHLQRLSIGSPHKEREATNAQPIKSAPLKEAAWCVAAFNQVAVCAAELLQQNKELQWSCAQRCRSFEEAADAVRSEFEEARAVALEPQRACAPTDAGLAAGCVEGPGKSRELGRHQELRHRRQEQNHTRELANVQLEEKIQLLQASLKATAPNSPASAERPECQAWAGSGSSSGSGCEAARITSPAQMRLQAAARRLGCLANMSLGIHGSQATGTMGPLGDLPELVERCGEKQQELRRELHAEACERRSLACKEVRAEVCFEQAESRLAIMAKGPPAVSLPAGHSRQLAHADIKGLWAELEDKQRELRCLHEARADAWSSMEVADAQGNSAADVHTSSPSGSRSLPSQGPTKSGHWCWQDCRSADIRPSSGGEGFSRASSSEPRLPSAEAVAISDTLRNAMVSEASSDVIATPRSISPRAYPPSPPSQASLAGPAGALRPHSPGCAPESRLAQLAPIHEAPERCCSDENAAEVFERAEALCEDQHFEEAAGLFRRVLAALKWSPDRKLRAVEAEVWAHLGVAMQSLDDIEAAIDSYRSAVKLDPTLHVCFANLATLYVYLEDAKSARENIERALELQPQNQAYLDIQESL